MTLDPHHQRPQRRSIRLPGYDYSEEGNYFVTITTHQMQRLFGEILDGEMHLNAFGKIVVEEWFKTAKLRPRVILDQDEFVVMPNHIHGIIQLRDEPVREPDNERFAQNTALCTGTARRAPTNSIMQFGLPISNSLPAIIGAFKSAVTKQINILRGPSSSPIWHRNYYEHIITSDEEYANITEYIRFNPQNWSEKDEYDQR